VATLARHTRGALALLVIAVLAANVAVVAQRSSGPVRILHTTEGAPSTTEGPGTDGGVVTEVLPPAPPLSPSSAPVAVPVHHVDVSREDSPAG